MKNEKAKNIVIGLLVAIIIILVVVIVFIYTDNKNYKQATNGNNQNPENINDDEIQNDNNFLLLYDETDFVRQTNITLVDEPNCTGNSSSLVANIENDGNISISQSGGASIVTPGNAKYLFRVGKLACSVVSLYYITNDNELYVLDNPRSDIDQTATKVTDSKVVEFLGTEEREVEDSYNRYLKVLLENGKVEYINYLTTAK